MPIIIVTAGDKEETYAVGNEPVTVGRSPASTIHIDDAASSRKHCMIKTSGEVTTIVDMGSANGTRVNGTKITREQVLRGGDVIQIGKTLLRFIDDDIS